MTIRVVMSGVASLSSSTLSSLTLSSSTLSSLTKVSSVMSAWAPESAMTYAMSSSLEVPVDRHQPKPRTQSGLLGDDPLRTVGAQQRHHVTCCQSSVLQIAGKSLGRSVEFCEGQVAVFACNGPSPGSKARHQGDLAPMLSGASFALRTCHSSECRTTDPGLSHSGSEPLQKTTVTGSVSAANPL